MTSTATTTYTVKVPVHRGVRSARTAQGTGMRTFTITEDATILGGIRAIDAAVAQCKGKEATDIGSPEIIPNPAELGWPVGV